MQRHIRFEHYFIRVKMNISTHLSSEYIKNISDKAIEKMSEMFINFKKNIEHNENTK